MNHSIRYSRRATCIALLGAALMPFRGSLAQGPDSRWPSKPITWLVGYPPGGSVDVITRLVARRLESVSGQSVVVENRPGASGSIAGMAVLKAPADGYTLITLPGPILARTAMPEVGKEFTAVALLATGATVLVGPASAGFPNVEALIDAMRKNPKPWSYATSGNGTGQHLAGELFNQLAGTKMVHVPYKGGGQAVADVVSGHVPLAVLGIPPVLPHIKSGALRAYAVTTARRQPSLPGVPTMLESGLSGYEASSWFVLAAPTGTPPERLGRLNAWVSEIVASGEIKDSLERAGLAVGHGSPGDVTRYIREDMEKWRNLARRNNLEFD